MADNSQNSQSATPPWDPVFGPRILASMPPLPVPPPSYRQVGPPPPTYGHAIPLAAPPANPAGAPTGSQAQASQAGPVPRPRYPIPPMRDAIPPASPSPAPEAPEPYDLSVIHEWTSNGSEFAVGQMSQGRPKKKSVTKPLELVLTDITRARFITAILGSHDLQAEYRVSPDRDGPPVKIWWKGSNGGRANACTIETNEEFDRVLNRVLMRPPNIGVNVLFCTDDMREWRARKRGVPDDGFEELGRAGPSNLADGDIGVNADIITALKQNPDLKCTTHTIDHGASGFCLKLPSGHVGILHFHFKVWAAGVAAGNATINNPPDHEIFRAPNPQPNLLEFLPPNRVGRAPGRRASSSISSTSDPSTVASSLAMTFAGSLAGALAAFNSNPGALPLVNPQLGLPVHAAPNLNVPGVNAPRTPSPVPEPGTEIEACITAFKEQRGIDLMGHIQALKHRDLGPDIIPEVPVPHLADLLHVTEGDVYRLRAFSGEWYKKLKGKVSN